MDGRHKGGHDDWDGTLSAANFRFTTLDVSVIH